MAGLGELLSVVTMNTDLGVEPIKVIAGHTDAYSD